MGAKSRSNASQFNLSRIADAAVEDPRHGWHVDNPTPALLEEEKWTAKLSACRRELEILAMLHEHRHMNVASGDGCLVTLCVLRGVAGPD